ncbi:MAG: YebC/PmpR family DNA-binding transcriptional regulator [Deltaproteobacteria bacterium]|nr:YebC/PmpR family DNA-binding transcriptional regulator [Deltaproteobacteria bacterium]
MSGHSKWSTIKHKKGAADARRGKIFTKLIKEITIAARMGGGDPDSNSRLRRAIDLAKSNNMPNDNVNRAVKKGTGELEGVSYEELTYEGVGPGGSLVLIHVVTDNRNRTAAELRKLFDRHNGSLSSAGTAGWAFEEKGVITLAKEAATEELLFDVAVGAGAEDVEQSDEQWLITTAKADLDRVRDALRGAEIEVGSTELEMVAKNKKLVTGRDAEVMLNLIEALEDHDDVQKVFSDFELSDQDLKKLSQ